VAFRGRGNLPGMIETLRVRWRIAGVIVALQLWLAVVRVLIVVASPLSSSQLASRFSAQIKAQAS
jgi:hypothetical protein